MKAKKSFYTKVFLILFLTISTFSFSQKKWDTKERKYVGGVALMGAIDVNQSKVIGLKPMGKDVTLIYDPYFDKYTIDWMEEDGPARMILTFSEENSGGKMYIDTYASKTAYFVHNHIERDNKVTVMAADPSYIKNLKVKLIFVFDDLK